MSEQTVNEIFSQVHNDMAIAEDTAARHESEAKTAVATVFTEADRVMIQEIHAVVKDLKDLGPQVMPVIESLQKHPMLKMLFK
jgi:hypothetical protein